MGRICDGASKMNNELEEAFKYKYGMSLEEFEKERIDRIKDTMEAKNEYQALAEIHTEILKSYETLLDSHLLLLKLNIKLFDLGMYE